MESVKSKSGKKGSDASTVERLSLRKEEQDKLESWVKELNIKFDGMIRLTKSDLANFLIRHHPCLSVDEIALIEAEHFDEFRWLNWATNRIRDAKKQGRVLTLNELLEARNNSSTLNTPTRKTRGRKPKNVHKEERITPLLSEKEDSLEAPSTKDSSKSSSLKNDQNS